MGIWRLPTGSMCRVRLTAFLECRQLPSLCYEVGDFGRGQAMQVQVVVHWGGLDRGPLLGGNLLDGLQGTVRAHEAECGPRMPTTVEQRNTRSAGVREILAGSE